MKKYTAFLILLILLITFAQPAFAEEYNTTDYIPEPGVVAQFPLPQLTSFPTAGHLWTYWQNSVTDYDKSPYPDYIAGVWSEDGGMENLVFGITDEAYKEEILNLVENDSTVSFQLMKYSHAELWAIQQELTDSLWNDTGAYGIGIYEMENHVHIDIDPKNKNSKAFMQQCFDQYGDRIVFEEGSGVFVTAESASKESLPLWFYIVLCLLCAMGGGFLIFRKRLAYARYAHSSEKSAYSAENIHTYIQNHPSVPNPGVYEKILKIIDE